jgi:large subunit ribosomal protein L32e
MIKMAEATKEKKATKPKKPTFLRQDIHKKKRLSKVWRKPRGLQSKQRLEKRGYTLKVKTGYGTDASIKGTDRTGLRPVLVASVEALEKVDPKVESILISSNVGKRKKLDIVKKAVEKKLTLSNVKDPEGFIKEVEKAKVEEKKAKKDKVDTRKKKHEEIEKKAKEDKAKEDKKAEETSEDPKAKEDKEKKELDKVLTQKE